MSSDVELRVIYNIANAPVREFPYPHIYVTDVFPQDFYVRLRENLPLDDSLKTLNALGRVTGEYPERTVMPLTPEKVETLDGPRRAFWKDPGQHAAGGAAAADREPGRQIHDVRKNQMEKRKVGPLQVSAVGLGLMSMSGIYGNANDDESIGVIHHAIDKGVDFLDSSDMYGWGHNETLLGKALKGRRDKALVVTKFGQTKSADGKQGVDGRPEYVMQACEASLKRLGVDVIDLYYQHRVDPNVPIEDTVGAMKRLVEQGKARALGLSEAAPETIRRAHKVHPIAAVQTEYSLLYRKEAEETLKTTRELGIAFVAYAPLGRSMLSGAVKSKADVPEGDRRLAHPRFQGENLDKNLSLVPKLEAMAKAKGCTLAQLVLAWMLAQGKDIVPIPGTKRRQRLDENVGALSVKLSADDLKRISEAVPAGAVGGTRYPAEAMKRVYI